MQHQPVQSSNLVSVGYDQQTKTLEIEFHGRRIYQYFAVPPDVYDALMQAASHGTYFHDHIKSAYQFKRIA